MSQRNSQEAKRAARERLRAEREKQAKKDKIRRQLIVGVSVVGVLAVATGIGFGVMKMNEPTGWEAAKEDRLVKPANASGGNGTEIVLGGKGAKDTLDIYEDPRCPACAQFEQGAGELLQGGADDNKYKMRVHLGDLIDNGQGGEGSKSAISALGSALNVSTDAFRGLHEKMYSAKHHPQETDDKFAEDSYLLKVAESVPELKGNKDFEKDVKDGTYDRWALAVVEDFNKAEIQGTPTVRINGKDVQQQQLVKELAKLGVKVPKK